MFFIGLGGIKIAISTATATSKGGLVTVIPTELMKFYGIHAGQKLKWTPIKDGKFVVERL